MVLLAGVPRLVLSTEVEKEGAEHEEGCGARSQVEGVTDKVPGSVGTNEGPGSCRSGGKEVSDSDFIEKTRGVARARTAVGRGASSPIRPPVLPPIATVAMAAAREVSLATLAAAHEATMAPKEKQPVVIKKVAPNLAFRLSDPTKIEYPF